MRPSSPEAVTWLLGAALSGFAALCAAAWVYEKTRKKIDHPELGPLTFEWDSWSGLVPHYRSSEPAIRFDLPGTKSGPDPEAVNSLLELQTEMATMVTEIRPHAIQEFEEIAACYEGEPEEELVEQISDGGSQEFDQHWSLVGLVLENPEHSSYAFAFEFEVEWDPEHTRSAYFDGNRNLLSYGLSCAGPEP